MPGLYVDDAVLTLFRKLMHAFFSSYTTQLNVFPLKFCSKRKKEKYILKYVRKRRFFIEKIGKSLGKFKSERRQYLHTFINFGHSNPSSTNKTFILILLAYRII